MGTATLALLLPVPASATVSRSFVSRIARFARRRARVRRANPLLEVVEENAQVDVPPWISVIDHRGICVQIVLAGSKDRIIPGARLVSIVQGSAPCLPRDVVIRLHVRAHAALYYLR